MIDPGRFAALLCGYCLDVQPGQQVQVGSSTLAAPLLLALQAEILRRDAWPVLDVSLPGQEAGFWEHARDGHLDGFPSGSRASLVELDATLRIMAPENTTALADVDPARIARAARARRELRELRMTKRWALTAWPTPAAAQAAGRSTDGYADMLERALFLDQPDPVAAWVALRERQAQLIERLQDARELRIEAPGTDLSFGVAGRTWVNSDGKRNMPSGEVFSAPLETSANGRIHFGVPSSPAGVLVSGVDLEFRDGVVVAARAEQGDAYLQAQLETDAGARRLGEIGIGTNPGIDRPAGSILLDEKMGGTVHLALGRAYPECGGSNESALHWDLICDLRGGGRLTADGEDVVIDGSPVA